MSVQQISNWKIETIYEKLQDENNNISDEVEYYHPKKTNNKKILLSYGRIWFNELLPSDFELITEPVTKKVMNNIITKLVDNYDTEICCDTLDKLQKESFKMASINPKSFNITGFVYPQEWLDKKEEFKKNAADYDDLTFIKEAQKLTDEIIEYFKEQDLGILDVIESGTKGGFQDWQALLVSRGLVIDVNENISRIVEGNNDGYSVDSYYKAAGQARRNYHVKSTLTAQPGYLARKITTANANIKISKVEDCKTKKYLEVLIDKDNVENYYDRYYLNDKQELTLITHDEEKNILGKKIKVRSPIYCKSKDGICQTCYGNMSNRLNTKNVGILAGGAINMVAINSMMKMRHKASQVNLVDINFIDIIKKSGVDVKKYNQFLKIDKNKIFTKNYSELIIDLRDYPDDSITETAEYYIIPGCIDIIVGEDEKNKVTLSMPFEFNVHIKKPSSENIETIRKLVILKYNAGEEVIFQDIFVDNIDMKYVNRLYDGGLKYIKNPEMLLKSMNNAFSVSSIHNEIIASNMFRSSEDLSIPGRLVNYKNCELIGCKKLGMIDSWLNGMAFENMNKVLKDTLLNSEHAKENPIEKVIMEKF
jgi:transcriptional regulator CtsR